MLKIPSIKFSTGKNRRCKSNCRDLQLIPRLHLKQTRFRFPKWKNGLLKNFRNKGNKVRFCTKSMPMRELIIRFHAPDGHLIEIGEEMHIFLKRIYEGKNRDLEILLRNAHSRRWKH